MKAALLAVLLLAGCASAPLMPEVVKVPIVVPCVDKVPERPNFITDAELKALDDFKLPLALAVDRAQRSIYEAHLAAAVEGCWQHKAGGL